MKICLYCGYKKKYLIRYYPSICPKCHHKWQSEPYSRRKYDISSLIIGGSIIIPWDKKDMMYVFDKSQVMRICIARQSKKLGWQVEVIRHIAGIKVTRLSWLSIIRYWQWWYNTYMEQFNQVIDGQEYIRTVYSERHETLVPKDGWPDNTKSFNLRKSLIDSNI